MTDSTLSSLRRRARQTGSTEDRAAVLVARLRSAPACDRCGGTGRPRGIQDPAWWAKDGLPGCPSCAGTGSLLRARVELAAYCGDEAARAALGNGPHDWLRDLPGGGPTVLGVDLMPLDRWVAGLSRWSDLHPRAPGWVLVRAAVAAARVALPVWEAKVDRGCPDARGGCGCPSPEPRRAIEAAEAWLDDPTVSSVSEWTRSCCRGTNDRVAWLPWPPRSDTEDDYAARVRHAAHLAGEAPVRAAICSALVAFALEDA